MKNKQSFSNTDICLFAPSLDGGGAEKVFANLAIYLQKKDFKSDLLLGYKKGINLNKISNQINIHSLETRGRYYIFGFIKYFLKNKPRKIYSTLLSANFTNCICKMLLFSKSIHVVREANIIILPNSFLKKLFLKTIYLSYYFADYIIANSQDTKNSLIKIYPFLEKKIQVIHNPVFFNKEYNKNPYKEKYLENNEVIFLGVGRLVSQKNFNLLIKSFYHVQKKVKSKLIILGNGDQKNKLIKTCNDLNIINKVQFLEYEYNIDKIYNQSNIFVLSSKYEGFGNVIVEAMLHGLPIVSTNCPGGPKEILNFGEFGYLANNDEIDLSNKMIQASNDLKNNKIDFEKLKKRSLDFSVENIAPKYFSE